MPRSQPGRRKGSVATSPCGPVGPLCRAGPCGAVRAEGCPCVPLHLLVSSPVCTRAFDVVAQGVQCSTRRALSSRGPRCSCPWGVGLPCPRATSCLVLPVLATVHACTIAALGGCLLIHTKACQQASPLRSLPCSLASEEGRGAGAPVCSD